MVSFNKKTRRDLGEPWWSWYRWIPERFKTPLSIVFAAVATHNHFVLDRGGKVFKQSALVIKLPQEASEEDYRTLLGILNSSTTCLWMKQMMFAKSGQRAVGAHRDRPEEVHFDFNATGLLKLPIPTADECSTVRRIAVELDGLAARLKEVLPESILRITSTFANNSLRRALAEGHEVHSSTLRRMIALQEELDWELYRIFGLSNDGACPEILNDEAQGITADSRPFLWDSEIPPDSVPQRWREPYVARRQLLRSNKELAIIEIPVYKRPWWGRQGVYGRLSRDYEGWTGEALASWLLDRLESYFDFDGRMNDEGKPTARLDIALTTVGKLADVLIVDPTDPDIAPLWNPIANYVLSCGLRSLKRV